MLACCSSQYCSWVLPGLFLVVFAAHCRCHIHVSLNAALCLQVLVSGCCGSVAYAINFPLRLLRVIRGEKYWMCSIACKTVGGQTKVRFRNTQASAFLKNIDFGLCFFAGLNTTYNTNWLESLSQCWRQFARCPLYWFLGICFSYSISSPEVKVLSHVNRAIRESALLPLL